MEPRLPKAKKPAPILEPLKPRDRFIGLDLSLTGTGVALSRADAHSSNISTGLLKGAALRSVERLHWYREKIVENWIKAAPTETTIVAMEGYSFGSRNSQAHSLGELGGVIRLALASRGVPIILVPPGTLKKFVTGKGTATKPEMAVGLFKRWGIEKSDDNEADAAALALYARCVCGIDEPTTKEQREALTTYEFIPPLEATVMVRRRSA